MRSLAGTLRTRVAVALMSAPAFDGNTYKAGMRVSPAFERNRGPILEATKRHIPAPEGKWLEVASGSGEHAAMFAEAFPRYALQPTEYDPASLASIAARTEARPGVKAPLVLDASLAAWPEVLGGAPLDVVSAINLCHISPVEATSGLLAGAGRLLRAGGRCMIYGPFLVDGKPTTPSNAAFDASLRSQDASWGIRDIAALDTFAAEAGLTRVGFDEMPANNFFAVFEKK